ncbi:MAG: hypothetical protein M3423_00450 [Actinomycetota bacterium]|nr:hypothetical protein [Actinomycetota bacterium]
MIGIVLILGFALAQGLVILVTAAAGLHLLKRGGWLAKVTAMALSYVAWVTITIVGYDWLGGEGGLMDGFGLVLFLCFTAFVSSFFLLIGWTLFDHLEARR